jgi:transmembrane 9 superfamily protein 2/4
VDNLPCATKFRLLDTNEEQYEHGYPLGIVRGDQVFINNHIKLILKYHKETPYVSSSLSLFFSILFHL